MSDEKTVTLDGAEYVLDTTGPDGGNWCLDCVANLGGELCHRLPNCLGGVWKLKEATE